MQLRLFEILPTLQSCASPRRRCAPQRSHPGLLGRAHLRSTTALGSTATPRNTGSAVTEEYRPGKGHGGRYILHTGSSCLANGASAGLCRCSPSGASRDGPAWIDRLDAARDRRRYRLRSPSSQLGSAVSGSAPQPRIAALPRLCISSRRQHTHAHGIRTRRALRPARPCTRRPALGRRHCPKIGSGSSV